MQITPTKKENIHYIDIAKGICLLLVIWIHVCAEFEKGTFVSTLNSFIIAFYMPLFFIVSGLFIKKDPMQLFLKKRIKTIIIPFLIFYIISYLLAFLVQNYLGVGLHNEFQFSNIFAVFYSRTFSNGALWFLVALFFVHVLLRIALSRQQWWQQLLIVLPISVLGFYWGNIFEFRMPLVMVAARLNIPDSIGLLLSYIIICVLIIPIIYVINAYFPFLVGKSKSEK